MAKGQPQAFFSYSREDSDFALRLAQDLKAAGASVWLDQLDILPGQRWDRAVEDALTSCPRMLVILSPASVNSTNVMDEVSFALEENKVVIPIVYKDCTIPFRLRRVQYLDFRRDYDRELKELLKTLAPAQMAEQSRLMREERREAEEGKPVEQLLAQGAERRQAGEEIRGLGLEQPSVAASELRRQVEQEDTQKAFSWGSLPRWAKILIPLCGILIVAIALYWALSRQHSSQQTSEVEKQQQPSSPAVGEAQKQQPQQPSTQTGEAPKQQSEQGDSKKLSTGTVGSASSAAQKQQFERGSWKNQSSPSNSWLNSVAFVTPQSGWATSGGLDSSGTILHTEDGGTHWQAQKVGGPYDVLNSVTFPTPRSGFAVGEAGIILHTEDGGKSWKQQSSGTQVDLKCIAFATPQSGWAVGFWGMSRPGQDPQVTILHTEDGGARWKKQNSNANEPLLFVNFPTINSGWVVGFNGTILHTEDGGASWKKQNSNTKNVLSSVVFATPQSGWVVGFIGTILHTEDGGSTWVKQSSGTRKNLHSVTFTTPQSGWIVGGNGTILHTEDGGSTWVEQSSNTSKHLYSVAFATRQSGWALGTDGTILQWSPESGSQP